MRAERGAGDLGHGRADDGIGLLLHSVAYGDSAYPSGRYALSNGLEGLVHTGRVAGRRQAGQALLDHLRHAYAPADGVATAVVVELARLWHEAGADGDLGLDQRAGGQSAYAQAAGGDLRLDQHAGGQSAHAQAAGGETNPDVKIGREQALNLVLALDRELTATKVTEAIRQGSVRVGRQTLDVYTQVNRLIEAGEKPDGSADAAKPSADATKPSTDATKPSTDATKPSTDAAKPSATTVAQHRDLQDMDHDLLDIYRDKVTSRDTDGNQAIALGLIHQRKGLTASQAVAVEMMGVALGWASAALRLRQCDHIGAQAMVDAAHHTIRDLAAECATKARWVVEQRDMTHIGSSSPGLDLASAAHHYAAARLFMN